MKFCLYRRGGSSGGITVNITPAHLLWAMIMLFVTFGIPVLTFLLRISNAISRIMMTIATIQGGAIVRNEKTSQTTGKPSSGRGLLFQVTRHPLRGLMPFTIESVHLGEIVVIQPQVLGDARGFFLEAFRADQFQAMGLPTDFVQDNHSRSSKGVLRGL